MARLVILITWQLHSYGDNLRRYPILAWPHVSFSTSNPLQIHLTKEPLFLFRFGSSVLVIFVKTLTDQDSLIHGSLIGMEENITTEVLRE